MKLNNDKAFILFLTLFTFILYANSLKNGFVWDDILFIEGSEFIKDWRNIFTIFTSSYFTHTWKDLDVNRPLMVLSLIFDYQIWGLNPFGYHLTNVFLHIANAVMVYALLKQITLNSIPSKAGSIVFAIHPIQTEAVNGINFREDLLITFFVLLAVIYLIRLAESDSIKFYTISIGAFIMALLSKETAVAFLPMAIVFLLVFNKKIYKLYLAGYVSVVVLYLIFLYAAYSYADIPSKIGRVKGIFPNLTSVIISVTHYCKLALLPINLSAVHTFNFPISRLNIGEVDFIALAILLIFAFIIWQTLKAYKRPALFCLLWILMMLLPALPVIITYLTIMERFLYLPMVGICGIIGLAYDLTPVRIRMLAFLSICVLFVVFAINTLNRNNVWKNESTLWSDTVRKAPKSEIAYNNLGLALLKEAKDKQAITAFRKSLSIRPNADAYYKLGSIYLKDHEYDLAIYNLDIALKTRGSADIPEIYNQLGFAYAMKGRYEEAIQNWLQYLKLGPRSAETYNNLGSAYAKLTLKDKAVESYQRALKIDPNYDKAKSNLAIILRSKD